MPIYQYPLPGIPEPNSLSVLKLRLPSRSEAVFPQSSSCSNLFNARLCSQDIAYFQPFFGDFAPKSVCDDSVLIFQARIDNVFSGGVGVFGFEPSDCLPDLRFYFVTGDISPAEYAAVYVDRLNAEGLAGLIAEYDGPVITLRVDRSLSGCDCNLRFRFTPLAADVTILRQPRCCTSPTGDDCEEEEDSSFSVDFAKMVLRIDADWHPFADPANEFAFKLRPQEENCLDEPLSAYHPGTRTSLSVSFGQYMMRVLNALQDFASQYGRSTVSLNHSAGTFTFYWDRLFFEANGIDICGKEWQVCTFSTGESGMTVQILTQPVCCGQAGSKPCDVPEGFAEFVFEVADNPNYIFNDPDNDVLFTLDYVSTGCLGTFFGNEADLRLSLSDNMIEYLTKVEGVMKRYFEGRGANSVTRTGNQFRILFDRAFYQNLGFDICKEKLKVCLFQPPTQVGLGQWIAVNILKQISCCPPPEPCPPFVPEADRLDFLFELPDVWNEYFSDVTNPTYGWGFDPSDENALITVTLTDGCCAPVNTNLASAAEAFWVGAFEETGRRFQYIRFNTSQIAENCFGFHFRLKTPCGPVDIFSEPFIRERCENTVVMESEEGSGGCPLLPGEPDDILGTFVPPLNRYRIRGSLERTAIVTEREELNGRLLKTVQTEEWTLRTPRLPEYVILRMADLLTRPGVRINGIAFAQVNEIRRNTGVGTMWHTDITLKRTVCESDGSCR